MAKEEYEGIEEECKPRDHFIKWAEENHVDMTHEEDWKPWWDCWCDGYSRCVEDMKKIL